MKPGVSRYILSVITSLILVCCTAYAERIVSWHAVRIPDINTLSAVYRTIAENEKSAYGEYASSRAVLLNRIKYSSEFNCSGGIISTPEGFVTLSYYSGKRGNDELNLIIDSELPDSKTAGLRLASSWLKLCAEDRVNSAGYQNVVDCIIGRSGLSRKDIADYYCDAIRYEIKRRIHSVNIEYKISAQMLDLIAEPLVRYYQNPTDDRESELIVSIESAYTENRQACGLLLLTMLQLNIKFTTLIIAKIHSAL